LIAVRFVAFAFSLLHALGDTCCGSPGSERQTQPRIKNTHRADIRVVTRIENGLRTNRDLSEARDLESFENLEHLLLSRLIRAGLRKGEGEARLSSCSSNVAHDRDESVSVPPGATVAFAPGTYEGPDNLDPAVPNGIVHRRIEGAIVRELQARGFKLVDDPETADFPVGFLVRVSLSTTQVTATAGMRRTTSRDPGWGTSWGVGVTRAQPVNRINASIVVDLVQRTTGNTAWSGIWQGNPGTRAPTQQEIEDVMRRIFRSAPTAD
jgi:uncharacterized protein DUF4136